MYDLSSTCCVKSYGENLRSQIGSYEDSYDKLVFLVPAKYMLEKNQYQLDLVLFA
jgi:hypothetical protein